MGADEEIRELTRYRVRPLASGEIISGGGRIIVSDPDVDARVIERGSQIAAVFVDGALYFLHEERGVVREPCENVNVGVDKLREMIGDRDL